MAKKKQKAKSNSNKLLKFSKASDYLKLFLLTEDLQPKMEYSGVFANPILRPQLMSKPQNYQMTFHVVTFDGEKAVITYALQSAVNSEMLKAKIKEFLVDIQQEHPDKELDLINSYVVIRL